MRKFVLPLLAVALLAGSALPCSAQDNAADTGTKPVATLAIASYDRLMSSLGFFGELTGQPDLDKNLEGMIQLFTQGQGFAGMDKTRPLGLSLTTDGLQFNPLVILPVNNLKQLLEALAGLVGEAQDAGDGVFELDVFGQKIFVKEKNGWAYMSQSPEALANLPKDAGVLFGGLEKQYDFAGRLYIQNVPEVFRAMLIDQLRMGVETGLTRQPDETDEAFAARQKMVEEQIASLTASINELEQLTLGVAIDPKNRSAHLDITAAALPNTASAKSMAQVRMAPSQFAGFINPEAAASINVTAKLSPDSTETYLAAIKAIRTQTMQQIAGSDTLGNEKTKQVAGEMLGHVFDAVESTLKSGQIDAGGVLQVGEKSFTLAAGAYVADPAKLEQAVKEFAKLREQDPTFPEVKIDAVTHDGVRFHTTSIPVSPEDKISKVLGDKLDIAVGIGEKRAYLAMGNDSLKLVQSLMDKSKTLANQEQPPVQVHLSLEPIFKFMSSLREDENAKIMSEQLAKAPGKDRVQITVLPQPNAVTFRVQAQEGVLRLLAGALANASAAGGLPGLTP